MHLLLLAASVTLAQAADAPPRGAVRDEVPLYRPWRGADRVFVEATLPDGRAGLFLVDTGAERSILTRGAAARLALPVREDDVTVQGLVGVATVDQATLPWLRLGAVVVPEVEVAVDVPGVQDVYGHMPIDGVLGSDVWSRFAVELDLRADVLTLSTASGPRAPRRATSLLVEDGHPVAPVRLVPDGRPGEGRTLALTIDTAASGLLLNLPEDPTLAGTFAEAWEPLRGLGATEQDGAPTRLHRTRHVALGALELGGAKLSSPEEARWIGWDDPEPSLDVRGLVGQELLDGRRAVLDFPAGRFLLARSRRAPAFHDGHAQVLARDVEAHGDAPSRWLFRAGLLLGLDRLADAEALLVRLVGLGDPAVARDVPPARVLLARLRRHRGDADGAAAALAPLGPEELVDQGELVAAVDALALGGRHDEAWDLLQRALGCRPDDPDVHLARADLSLLDGDADAARAALARASALIGDADAELPRRVRVAEALGDHDGALSLVRSGMQRDPLEGRYAWLYARLARPDDAPTLRRDLEHALARVHDRARPLPWLAGAWASLGDADTAARLVAEGVGRDCAALRDPVESDACVARYEVLSGQRTDAAVRRLDRALAEGGPRADLLELKADAQLARGEVEAARASLLAALRLTPDDPWLHEALAWVGRARAPEATTAARGASRPR
jgi:tetratricopeptide (TPR) repeat protein